ncbi:MAG: alpha/beta fold hydrolase [bacterium]
MIFLWILIGLFTVAFLLFHAIAFSLRWYEEARRTQDARGLWEFSPRDALPILVEMACQAALLALCAADWLLAFFRGPWRRRKPRTLADAESERAPAPPPPSTGARPIVFVHGLGMRGLTMLPLSRKFLRAGRTVHHFTYRPPWSPIEAAARQLHDFIEGLCREAGYAEFDAVGHSMGGIVLRRYLWAHEGSRRVRRIVTVGAPHGGSELWRFSLLGGGRQLRPGGDFLRRLDAAGLPAGVEATAIASDFDQLVIPNANARWEAPGVENRTVTGAGHARLLFHPETFRIAREALP